MKYAFLTLLLGIIAFTSAIKWTTDEPRSRITDKPRIDPPLRDISLTRAGSHSRQPDPFAMLHELQGLALDQWTQDRSLDSKARKRIEEYVEKLSGMLYLSPNQESILLEGLQDDPEGKDALLESILSDDQWRTYLTHALDHQRQQVEDQANAELASFLRKYDLDDAQQDQLFQAFVYYHVDSHPMMQTESSTQVVDWPQSKETAIAHILTAEQRETYLQGLQRWRDRR